jgi:hypothetical protein
MGARELVGLTPRTGRCLTVAMSMINPV